ncbi:uncharacterized protein TNIN_392061 [Trichonephila inaurata madagascariensis]|uniref:Uncharacterized protein n=1 Tax=Trichonephila inaurata madagascariensis TaxID=2747483 RepID=A0A8X6XCE3_9ARAC|nr:uncharacterized protein TNIN_392061 [Trichonephila inaurata madagascariensis]
MTSKAKRKSSETSREGKRTKFLCSQVTAPIRNEEGVICMFIINFEDITNAPYRDAAVSPLPSPARILLNRFPALWRLVPRSRLKPGHAREMPLKGCEGSFMNYVL